ncbi:hypothetical protein WD019_04560 [Fictibacillus sp. Mic-4]|uniref:hypothetical protein n=1 Tax=Fictibacillus sp. Mic-4 TaxID=3132826 RepID=UPI003CE7100C
MSDINVQTTPTPIQRNAFDVAIELTELHRSKKGMNFKAEDIEETFAKYYALVRVLESSSYDRLQELVSEDILSKLMANNY